MKKLQLKQKIKSVIKRFPHYVLVGGLLFLIASTLTILWLVHRSNATNGFKYIAEYPTIPLSSSTFNNPLGIAHDSSNAIYVADSSNARIEKFNSDGSYNSQFGSRGSAPGSLNLPTDVAVDSDGNIYVTDVKDPANWDNEWSILKFSSNGVFLAEWTNINSGCCSNPRPKLAIDDSNNIYAIGGDNDDKVYKYNTSGALQSSWQVSGLVNNSGHGILDVSTDSTGHLYIAAYWDGLIKSDNDGSNEATIDSTQYIVGVDIDQNDNIYELRYNGEILKLDSDANFIAQYGGYAYTGNGGLDGFFNDPSGINVSDNKIWVSATSDDRLQALDAGSGNFLLSVGSLGDGQLNGPVGVALDSGSLTVLDKGNGRVQNYDTTTGNFTSKFGSPGVGDGEFWYPSGRLAKDSSGNTYATDNSRVQKFDSNGNYLTQFGSSGTGDGQFNGSARGIITDSSDNVYVSEYGSTRIQKFDSSGNFVLSWQAFDEPQFNVSGYIRALTKDTNGNLYVATRAGEVRKFDTSGNMLDEITLQSSDGPIDFFDSYLIAIAISSQGYIYTAEGRYSVAVYAPDGTEIDRVGSLGSGNLQFNLDVGGGWGDIAVDSNNNVYIADYYNNRVVQYEHILSVTVDAASFDDGTVGSSYSASPDIYGYTGNLSVAVSSGSLPPGLTIDSGTGEISGTPTDAGLYNFTLQATDDIGSDTQSFSIRVLLPEQAPDVTTNAANNVGLDGADLHGTTSPKGVTERGFEYGLTTSYGSQSVDSGELGYTYSSKFGSNGSSEGQFDLPEDVVFDSLGNAFVSDRMNARIQKFDSNWTFLTEWGSDGAGDGQFDYIRKLAVDSQDNVYAVDYGNNRIQKFDNDGNFLLKWGSYGQGNGEFISPEIIAIDENDNVYVDGYDEIQRFDSDGNYLSSPISWGGNWSNLVTSIASDKNGNLYTTTAYLTYDKLHRYNLDGVLQNEWSIPDLVWSDAETDSAGNVYIIGNKSGHSGDVIYKYNSSGSLLSSWATPGAADGEFSTSPQGIGLDIKDNVYGVDTYGYRIQKFTGVIDVSVSGLNCGTTYHYRAYSTNNIGTSYGDDQTFTTDACPQVSIDTATLPDGQVAEAYSQTIATSGGAGTKVFAVASGSLPGGLVLNTATGEISGTATNAGDFTFTISVTDDYSNDTAGYTVTIAPLDNPLAISTLNLPDGTVGEAYTADVDVSNALGDVTYSVSSGSLPDGLSLDQSTGEISGTPTTSGDADINITATDDYSTDTQNYTFTIAEAPVPDPINITTVALSDGTIDVAYSATISSDNGVGDVSYSVVDGALPDGLSFSTGGVISGTPTDPGTFQFTVRATDDNGTDDQVLQIVINPAQESNNNNDSSNDDSSDSTSDSDDTSTSTDDTTTPAGPAMYIDTHYLLDARVGEAYLDQILVKYSSGSLNFTQVDGNLPEGLSLTTTGYISGIPKEAGEYSFSIKAKSDNGTDTEQYTITVTDDGAETTGGTTSAGGSKEEQIAAQTEEISKTNATLADMIASFARRLNITPKQALYGAPWVIVGVFAVFTAVSISQMLAQAKYYQDTKKRQAVHKKLLSEKATFLSLASHYLRTPFTVIKGGIDLAAKTVSDATKGMRDATEKLGEKINGVIERIENENKK